MCVEETDGCDEHAEREGVVGGRFVGFVEGVGGGELGLVVFEFALLGGCEDGELGAFPKGGAVFEIWVFVCIAVRCGVVDIVATFNTLGEAGGEIILVRQGR